MKLKITTSQYNTILINEQQARSNSNQLNESVDLVLMGFSKMIGVPLTGLNKTAGDKALEDKTIIIKIKDTIENKHKLKSLIDKLEEKGMENPSARLSKNPQNIIDKYNKIASDKGLEMMGSDGLTNLNELA
jgi:hypothetical protein